ncbi:RNAse PH [Amycolatopsis marina]|uniref:Ribonuclease PH n=1 Tax=Amycolatopsis marina TaxID=490629 RepID=A0A1I0YMY9_9PSEU|nr:RNAse PH [Amycolatopsis marina]
MTVITRIVAGTRTFPGKCGSCARKYVTFPGKWLARTGAWVRDGGDLECVPVVRKDGRTDEQLREVKITRGFQRWPAGSVLIEFGDTRVLCAASVTEGVPRWRAGSGLGWVTAEYAMLPSATNTRSSRESVKGKIGGRTHEISRLIGRSLRACIDLAALGENTIVIDCDVIQADGGTRTAAITGGYVALADAITWLGAAGRLADPQPLSAAVSAISVGVVDGRVRLDLPFEEDSRAEVDTNVVATDVGTLIEVQGTGEGATFTRSTLDKMLDMALAGCAELSRKQAEALALPYPGELPEPQSGKKSKGGK